MDLPADAARLAGWLLVAGTVLGLAPVAWPPLLTIWTGTREHHLATVLAHERSWIALNAGFALATAATAAAITILGVIALPTVAGAAVLALGVAYAAFGGCWVGAVAIRARTTPAIARLVAAGTPSEPSETLVGAVVGGLFGAFIIGGGGVLVGLGIALGVGDLAPAWLAVVTVLSGVAFVASQLLTGDCVPAALYVPTFLLGIVLLTR